MSLHTTTVRFTADQWAFIVGEADRLGIARSAFIRDAVIVCIGRRQAEDRIGVLEARVDALAGRVERLAEIVGAVIKRAVGGR